MQEASLALAAHLQCAAMLSSGDSIQRGQTCCNSMQHKYLVQRRCCLECRSGHVHMLCITLPRTAD